VPVQYKQLAQLLSGRYLSKQIWIWLLNLDLIYSDGIVNPPQALSNQVTDYSTFEYSILSWR